MVGYIDYSCADLISKHELISMAKEFGLDVKGCSFGWIDVNGQEKGLQEIKNNLDVLSMAMLVGSNREMYVDFEVANAGCAHGAVQTGCNDEAIGELSIKDWVL